MSVQTNIPNTELATKEDRESEELQAKRDFEQLGTEDSARAIRTLHDIFLTNTSAETDEEFNAILEYRHQYTLQTLLEVINTHEYDKEFGGDSNLRTINAIQILAKAYPEMVEYRPDSALKVAKGLCTKIQEIKTLGENYSPFGNDKKGERKAKNTYAICNFFEIVSQCSNYQSEEITINTFRVLFQNINKTDYLSFARVEDILENYFKVTTEKRNYELFEHLTISLFDMVGTLHPSSDENKAFFNSATQIYKYIFKLSENLPSSLQLQLQKKIFDESLVVVCNSSNLEANRGDYLGIIWDIISEDKKWSRDDNVRNQQISFHIKALDAVQNLLTEIIPDKNHSKNDFICTAYRVLGELLVQYANMASGRDENWVEISKKHNTIFKNGLHLYLAGLEMNDERLHEDILNSLNKILNVAQIAEANHPFHKEGILFYKKYFTEEANKLKKKS